MNDEKFAKGKKPIPWMIPADKLYEVLQQKTRGRILRVDKRLAVDRRLEAG